MTEPLPQESPESRLIGAGYLPSGLAWMPPGEPRFMSLEEALAELDGDDEPEAT